VRQQYTLYGSPGAMPNDYPAPVVHFVPTLLRARDWQERPEFAQVCDWWRAGGKGVLALVGIGGAGKTAIADRFVRSLPGVTEAESHQPPDTTLPVPEGICHAFAGRNAPRELHKAATGLSHALEDSKPVRMPFLLLSHHDQALFMNQWALYLENLERLQEALACFAFSLKIRLDQGHLLYASIVHRNRAELDLLAGRLAAALQVADEALRLAASVQDDNGCQNAQAYRACARGLRGETTAALAELVAALARLPRSELRGLHGYHHASLLARAGQFEAAAKQAEDTKALCNSTLDAISQKSPCACSLEC
jgi:tetratricopeptide (TPR) repeat protein